MRHLEVAVDIIVPVYGAREVTLACLQSVLDSLNAIKLTASVVVVYDAGPDLTLRDTVLEMADNPQVQVLLNDHNLGFVRSVNRGMSYRPDRDVVLLNSDTLVHGDWLDRLQTIAYQRDDVATVTPFSNNAEICSWPALCQQNALPSGFDTPQIDTAFAALGPVSEEIPTAVGFCMYIRRDALDRTGLFDAAEFGQGYGEENDFCMRAAALGYRHLLACNVFVYHEGGASFGEEKAARLNNAISILNRLYPDYAALIARHIDDNPAGRWRFAAELALLRNRGLPLVLHISHGIGGGTDKHVVELCHHLEDRHTHAMLVPQAASLRLVFPGIKSGGLFEFPDTAVEELAQLLRQLGLAKVHVHHVKGWERRLDALLHALSPDAALPVDVTLHDYYFLHPNPALADTKGAFCADITLRDTLATAAIALPSGFDANAWRRRWGRFLARAQVVYAPSQACAAIYHEYFPALYIQHAYHPDWREQPPYPAVTLPGLRPGEKFRVAVLGAVSIIKGANQLDRVSALASGQGAAVEFHLVGYAYKKLNPAITTTGPYHDDDLAMKLQTIKPHLIWFPCSWPETYSYTLSNALQAGLPLLAPTLGAFPERLLNRPASWLLDWRASPEQSLQKIEEIVTEFGAQEKVLTWHGQPACSFDYRRDYAVPALPAHQRQIPCMDWQQATTYWLDALPEHNFVHRRLFRLLVWLHCHPLLGSLAELIPLKLRQSIKRKLSPRPLHE